MKTKPIALYFSKLLAATIFISTSLHTFAMTTNPYGGDTANSPDVPFFAIDVSCTGCEEYKSFCTGAAVTKCISDSGTLEYFELPIFLVLPDNDPVVSSARAFSWDFPPPAASSSKPTVTCTGAIPPATISPGTYSVTIDLSAGTSCALTITSPSSSTIYTATLSRTGNVYSVTHVTHSKKGGNCYNEGKQRR